MGLTATATKSYCDITCKMITPLYRKVGDKFEKAKKHLKANESRKVFHIEGDVAELEAGYYILDINNGKFKISYGELTIQGKGVMTCSKNGMKLRKLKEATKLRVSSIRESKSGAVVYGINDLEFISSDEEITFLGIK